MEKKKDEGDEGAPEIKTPNEFIGTARKQEGKKAAE